MKIFIRELKIQRKSLLFWCLGMLIMLWTGMEKYSGFKLSGNAANEILSQLPKSVQNIVGIKNLDVNSAVGFFGIMFIYIAIMAAIQAVLVGSSLITKEERDKTIEFLASKPISRSKIIAEKLLAGILSITILNIFTLTASLYIVASNNSGNPETKFVVLFLLAIYFIQLIYLSFGCFIAAIVKKPKKASYVASGIMMLGFVLYIFMGITTSLSFIQPLSPFKYFEPSYIIQTSTLKVTYVGLSIFLVAIFMSGTFYYFKNKDLDL